MSITKTILIADDSPTMRSLLISTIEVMGDYRIIEACSGFDALRLLPREKVDLILTDINMPDINGLELISCLRNNDNYRTVPVIIVSTEGSERDIEKGKRLGANEYLIKPFNPDHLRAMIASYLGISP